MKPFDCNYTRLEKQKQPQIEEKLRPLFNIGDTIIHKELGGDYIHEPHKIVRIDMLNKKYYSEDGYYVKFSEQDDYELFI